MSSVSDNNVRYNVEEFTEFAEARNETLDSIRRKYKLEPVDDVCVVFLRGKRCVVKGKDINRVLKEWNSVNQGVYAQA